jgi:hypothetical protein
VTLFVCESYNFELRLELILIVFIELLRFFKLKEFGLRKQSFNVLVCQDTLLQRLVYHFFVCLFIILSQLLFVRFWDSLESCLHCSFFANCFECTYRFSEHIWVHAKSCQRIPDAEAGGDFSFRVEVADGGPQVVLLHLVVGLFGFCTVVILELKVDQVPIKVLSERVIQISKSDC